MKPHLFFLTTLALASAALAAPDDKPTRTEREKFLEKNAVKSTDTPAPAAATATAQGEDVPAQMIADFFTLIQKGQIDDAYASLTKGSKTIQSAEDLKALKQKTREAIEVFGAVNGYELVETKPVGTKLMRRTYLSLGAEFPLRWRFYFYNANNRWRLIDLRVDDRLVGMFDEPKDAAEDAKTTRP